MDDHSNFGHFLRVHVFLIGVVKGGYQQGWINKDDFQKTRITNETWDKGLLTEKINLFSKPHFNPH